MTAREQAEALADYVDRGGDAVTWFISKGLTSPQRVEILAELPYATARVAAERARGGMFAGWTRERLEQAREILRGRRPAESRA